MSESERAERVVLLTRMFDAYRQPANPSRIDIYLGLLPETIPLEAVREGITNAMAEVGEFPPGPGTVRRAALSAARMRPGDPPIERQQPGPRIGPSEAPIGAGIAALERRVEHSYRRVIERAREIRAERRLPEESLDARLRSLGDAERDVRYQEPPYACHCVPRCVPGVLDRSLAEQREAAGERLRAAGFAL